MDRVAEQILSGEHSLALFLLLSPSLALCLVVGYFALAKLRNGHGKANGRTNGAGSQLSVAGLAAQVEALKVMVKQVLDKMHSIDSALSALRQENRARADSDARLRERIAAIEAAGRARE